MTGTCPECKLPIRLDEKGRIAEHDQQHRRNTWAPPAAGKPSRIVEALVPERCAGSLHWSEERRTKARSQNGKRRKIKTAGLVARFREAAAVALDAAIEGRTDATIAIDTAILLRVSLYDYRARHHGKGGGQARSIVEYRSRTNRDGSTASRGDLYCRFCGLLLAQNVRESMVMPWLTETLFTPGEAAHVIPCALKHLAFNLAPVPPGTALLPESARFEDPATLETP